VDDVAQRCPTAPLAASGKKCSQRAAARTHPRTGLAAGPAAVTFRRDVFTDLPTPGICRLTTPIRTLLRRAVLGSCVVFGAVGAHAAHAQEPTPVPAAARPDTAQALLDAQRSPRGAMIRSFIVPGWGQAWVGSPGRGAVYFALEAGSVWMLYKTIGRLNEARAYEDFLRETGQLAPEARYPLARAREAQREDWITLAVFLLFFSAADAYVAAQLADFDERVAIVPSAGGGLELRARLRVGAR
jgi:hypothetical protein